MMATGLRRILTLISVLVMVVSVTAVSRSPKYEMRGAWLVTAYGIDWPSCQGVSKEVVRRQQQELDSMLTQLHRAGINAVFFQVRPMADAFYESSLEPWSGFLTGSRGASANYDPLARCVSVCHSLGMECHAWINPFRVGTRQPATAPDRRYASLWMTNSVGKSTMTIFNPALDETRRHLCDICREVAVKYDIDGIVFDDYFYNPEFIPEDATAADWKQYVAAAESGMSMADWRRDNINRAIGEVYATLSTVKDGKIRFGVSPQGIGGANGVYSAEGVPLLPSYGVVTGDSQYAKIYCDPIRWLKDGIVDYISPQIYWTTDNPSHPYGGLSRWWNDVAEMYGRHCFPSQTMAAFAKNNTPEKWEETLRQIELNREYSFNYAPGTVLYSSRFIVGNFGGRRFGETLKSERFAVPALVPPMRWKSNVPSLDLHGLTLGGDGVLRWHPAGDARYVIYAIPEEVGNDDVFNGDCDGIAPEFIVAVTYNNVFTLPERFRNGHRIAVAPYDRYGIEWQPKFIE